MALQKQHLQLVLIRRSSISLEQLAEFFKGVDARLASDGELVVSGGNIALGYYKKPKATNEAWKDGWFHTGDIAEIDERGFIKITDRKKDLIVNAGGKNIAPKKIEGALKNIPYASQALSFGDRKPYLVALITLDEESIKSWATKNLKDFDGTLEELSKKKEVRALIGKEVEKVNESLPVTSK